jgi:hypothetical protein
MSASGGDLAGVYAGTTIYAASSDGVSIAENIKNHGVGCEADFEFYYTQLSTKMRL